MSKRIIYRNDAGGVSVVIPSPEAQALYGIDLIAQKDVPEGKPYKIVDTADLPSDRSQRSEWTVEDVDLTDGVGAAWASFDEVLP